ncbi:MAG: Uncharacterized protein AWT59_3168, partial [Candidatus Gallionella acididurans]
AMAVLAGLAQAPDFGRWVIMLAIFNGMLLVPKATVVLTDSTGTQGRITVANVPLGLASFASSVSHIGDWLTRSFETTFALPSDIQFRLHGTLWGQRVQEEMLHTKFTNSILTSNLLEFYRECVVPEYATGYIVASDLAKSNDIWTYLSGKTNPGRLVTIGAVPGSTPVAGTYGCDIAYGFLTTQIAFVNTDQINSIGSYLFPGVPTAAANAAIQGSIQTSTNYILGISSSAVNTVRQTAMSNFMIDAQYMLPAQIGDAAGAASNLAQAQAIRSTSDSYNLMAKLATSTMPKVKNIVEIVQYSVFPIIMLIVMLCGHKGGLVLKAYVMSLFWVQLWPPLYAVLHLVMTVHAQDLATMTGGHGLSMSQYSLVNNAYISDEAIAGMIAATAIPAIAAAIVKGGDVGAQAIAGMVSPSREADKVASSIASGNIQMGNGSMNNQSADNLSQGHYDAQPTYTGGMLRSTNVGSSGSVEQIGNMRTIEGGGSKVTIDSATGRAVSANIAGFGMGGSSVSSALGKSASEGDFSGTGTTAQKGQNVSLGDTVTEGLSKGQTASFNRAMTTALNESTGTGTTGSTGQTGGRGNSTNIGTGGETGLANSEGENVNTTAGVRAGGSSGGGGKPEEGTPAAGKNGKMDRLVHALGEAGGYILKNAPVGASGSVDFTTGQNYSEGAKKTIAQASQEEIKQAFSIMANAAHQVAATTNDSGVKQAAQSLESTLNKTTTFDSKAVSSLLHNEEAGNRKEAKTENKNAVSVDNTAQLFDTGAKMLFGKNLKESEMTPAQLTEFTQEWNRNPGFRDDVAMQVRDDMNKNPGLLNHNVEPPKTQDQVAADGQGNIGEITKKGHTAVAKQHVNNFSEVKHQQYADPKSTPDLSGPAKAYAAAMGHATEEVQHTQSKIALDSGIDIAATALYQDRQKGVSTVMGNAFLGGAGSASMADYAAGLSSTAQKDPELARGLATIALNQQHGQAPTTKEIQWVNDRANGAVQTAEGAVSSFNGKVLDALNENTFNMFKPEASKPVPR